MSSGRIVTMAQLLPAPSDTIFGRFLLKRGRRELEPCECFKRNKWQSDCGRTFRYGEYDRPHHMIASWSNISYPPNEAVERGTARRL